MQAIKHCFKILLLAIPVLFLLFPMKASPEVIVEGVAAIVAINNRTKVRKIIYLSDLKRYTLFFKPIREIIDSKKTLSRVIDQSLLRPEAHRFVLEKPTEAEAIKHLNFIRRRFKDEAHFQTALKKTGLLLDELKAEVIEYLWVEKLLNERVKAFVFITPNAVESYYNEHPESFPERRLEEVEPVIESILTGGKVTLKKQEYINRLKEKATITILPSTPDSKGTR